ncbi:MAG: HAMP domain-containing sensor histidine kinase [Acidobacteriota bacterium]
MDLGLPVRRSMLRVLIAGFAAAALVGLAGGLAERWRFGADDAAARVRIEQEVRAQFAAMAERLDDAAAQLAGRGAALGGAARDAARLRELFNAAGVVTRAAPFAGLALTVYGDDGRPLAWAGRPSTIPRDRLAGPSAVFLAPGPQGLRLVRIEPVVHDGARVGVVAAEAPLPREPGQAPGDLGFVLETSVVPVHLRARFEGAADAGGDALLVETADGAPLAAVEISSAAIAAARALARQRVWAGMLGVLVASLLLLTGPLLDLRRRQRRTGAYLAATFAVAGLIAAARATAVLALRLAAVEGPALSRGAGELPLGDALLGTPLDLLLTALAVAALAALMGTTVEHWRVGVHGRRRRLVGAGWTGRAVFLAVQAAGAAVVGWTLVRYEGALFERLADIPVDVLQVSLHPWDANRLAVVTALVLLQAAGVALAVHVLQIGRSWWIVPVNAAGLRAATLALWLAPWGFAVLLARETAGLETFVPGSLTLPLVALAAWTLARWRTRLRRATQAARLAVLYLALALPALSLYPTLLAASEGARHERIETRYAPEVVNQRRDLQFRLREALEQIDDVAGLEALVARSTPPAPGPPPTDAAFLLWSQTALADLHLTSSVELYDEEGALSSRFALKLPEAAGGQPWTETSCTWEVFEEVSPFFAEERRLLHAGRAVCVDTPDGIDRRGSIVVHVMLDYSNLSFISAQEPYVALLRSPGRPERETPQRPIEFAVYGWSRRALYASGGEAWPLADDIFARAFDPGREPFWATVERAGVSYDVYYLSDRGGIYALGYRRSTPFEHAVTIAEVVTLAGLVFILMLAGGWAYGLVAERTPASGRELLREVRASFYRKLFLAIVLASVAPVLTMAFATRAYITTLMQEDIEMEATRTAAAASRVVEDFGSLQDRGLATIPVVDDNLVVWLSRIIAQDVNIFEGAGLLASSERNLFASGLLPTRTPGDVYRALMLEGRPTYVGQERVGAYEYLVAAAPVRVQNREAILTVPLTLRQQEIEAQIDELDRRIVLAVLLFILMGAAIGYSMAERIADPVNRLTRATRRIARGELDTHVLATSTDEFRRLVEAFNTMADDLQRQRAELERTNRLAAWADMARQVAHDIKNPLTPVQLNAEHLLRVHADRGRPLGRVVDDCVAAILMQVRLLRQIAAEFSSFASSPTPRPEPASLADLVAEVIEPYRTGLAGRIGIDVDVPADLPRLYVDRTLVGRALTNVVENALHAMPGQGRLRLAAVTEGAEVRLDITDTGVGMDEAAAERIFEPYFSTKATGTGLGLTIARRNVELNGGRIAVRSRKGDGTTVSLWLPIDSGVAV